MKKFILALALLASTAFADGKIKNADINSAAGIVDTKLATISTPGKVANAATTATSVNTNSAIVARNSSGDFSAHNVTANSFIGPVTGNIVGNVTGNLLGNVVGNVTGNLTGNADTATALAALPTSCSIGQFANAIDTQGNLTCAPVVAGGTIWGLITGTLSAQTDLQSALDLKADLASPTFSGTVTAPTFSGALAGNASTASALAANPTDCSAGQFATAIAANGNLTCSAPVGDVAGPASSTDNAVARFDTTTGKLLQNSGCTIDDSGVETCSSFVGNIAGNSSTATALAANPTDCGANTYATTIAANGNLTCASITNAATTATSANTASTIVARDSSGGFSAGTISAIDMYLNGANGAGQAGTLNVQTKGDGLGQGITVTSVSGTKVWDWAYRDSGDVFLYDTGGSVQLALNGAYGGKGPASPLYAWDVNGSDTNTDTTAISVQGTIAVRNTANTVGDFSTYASVNAANVADGALEFIHETHASPGTAHLSVMLENAGSLAEAFRFKADKSLRAFGYSTGLGHFDSSGNLTSSAVDVASADITGRLAAANFRQSAALSVVGNATNSTANVADIAAGSDNQVLRRSGTAIAFGSLDLSQSNTVGSSILPVANGGSGQSSYTDGQLLIGKTTGNTLNKATLTQGAGISITNGSGAITIATADPSTSAISASDIDWSTLKNTGGLYTKTLGAATTFTFSNKTAGQTIVVRLTNTASNYTVTWPTVKWSAGVTPTMTIGAKSDVYTFVYDGTDIFGSVVQNF